jgi:hypothetical protein
MIFHLLTVFPNNVAEQKRYYITNMLKKPQHVTTCQIVQCVEQLNSHIVQLPCWYYSPSAKLSMILMNVPFAEVDLTSYVLWMCPHLWQDHFSLHKKGMIPMDMCLLLLSFKGIECECTQERFNAQSNKKVTRETRDLVPCTWARFPRKLAPRCIATSARSMRVHIP